MTIEEIGNLLKKARATKNIPQKLIVEETGITQSSLSRIENGQDTSVSKLLRVCDALSLRLIILESNNSDGVPGSSIAMDLLKEENNYLRAMLETSIRQQKIT